MKVTAVEIAIYECHRDLDGKTTKGTEAEDDFIVYPAQIVMLPGDEVGVQVRWIGKRQLSREKAYTIVVREVPVPKQPDAEAEDTPQVRVDVTVLVNYEGRIYVAPEGAEPDIVAESVTEIDQQTPAGGGDAAQAPTMLEVICANRGTARKKLKTMRLVLLPVNEQGKAIRDEAVTLTIEDVPDMKTTVFAGDRRRFLIPKPADLRPGPIRAVVTE